LNRNETAYSQLFGIEEDRTNLSTDFGNKKKANLLIPKSSRLNRRKRIVPKLFRSKGEQTEVFQNCSGTKRSKEKHSKLDRNEEEEQLVFQIFSGTKRNKYWYSKHIQKQRGTNQIIPILFRTKVEQTNFQDRLGTNQSSPKKNNVEQKEAFPKLVTSVY